MEKVPEQQLPPLQDPKILKKIFKGSSLPDVKMYRLVCKSWNLASSEALQKSAKLQISGHDFWWRHGRGLEAFMTLVDNELCTLTTDSFPNSVRIWYEDIPDGRFWQRFGNQIKSLELDHVIFPSIGDFRDAIYYYCSNLENLKMIFVQLRLSHGMFIPLWYWFNVPPSDDPRHLEENRKLKVLEVYDLSDETFCFSLFGEFFNHFPDIEVLHATRCRWECGYDAIFRALQASLQNGYGRFLRLKEVHLSLQYFGNLERTAEVLSSQTLALFNLDLLDFKWSKDLDALQMVLEGHASSLQRLSLEGKDDKKDYAPMFLTYAPTLEKLKELRLSIQFNPINLWRCVPYLKKLVLDFVPLEVVADTSILKSKKLRKLALRNCVELEYREGSVEVTPGLSRWLTSLLPNLRILKLYNFEKEVFTIACQSFPKLVELSVVASGQFWQDLECAITGLEREDVERINRGGKSVIWKPIAQPRAGLPNLQRLKVLSIRSDRSLGCCSATHGIELVPALQQLHLDFDKVDPETWNTVWKPLLAKFPWKGK